MRLSLEENKFVQRLQIYKTEDINVQQKLVITFYKEWWDILNGTLVILTF